MTFESSTMPDESIVEDFTLLKRQLKEVAILGHNLTTAPEPVKPHLSLQLTAKVQSALEQIEMIDAYFQIEGITKP